MTTLQKAFTAAKRRAGVRKEGGIHGRRHAFATLSSPTITLAAIAIVRAVSIASPCIGAGDNAPRCCR